MRHLPILVILISLLISVASPVLVAEDSSRVYVVFQNLEKKYAEKFEELAKWCDENGLEEQAATTRNWAKPEELEDEIRVSPLPKEFQEWKVEENFKKNGSNERNGREGRNGSKKRSKATASHSSKENSNSTFHTSHSTLKSEWETQFHQIRLSASKDFLKLAKKAVADGHVTFGFGLLMRALREDPDCENARKILGYTKTKTGWVTDFEKMQAKMGNVWHETYGWIPKKYVKKYEDGQRFLNGQWVSAEQDAAFHSNIERGWVVETGHFQIITDASLEEGVATGQKLEKLYRVWKQLFLNYYATEAQIRSLFESGSAKFAPVPRHRVLLFKTAAEYESYLTAKNMMVPGAVGVYVHRSTGEGVACFIAEEEDDRTMYHEVTHQLFEESCKTNPKNGANQNYWVIEAASTFMESFHDAEDGSHAVGGFDDERLKSARIFAVNMNQLFPFEEFARVNRVTWQSSPHAGAFYGQACGMAHFLVFYDHGKYRDAFGRILFDVYSGRDSKETLTQHTGSDWETLNREYKEYISRDAEVIKGYIVK